MSAEFRPFNLEEALAGKPVVTRDGRKVSEFYHFKTQTTPYSVSAVIDGSRYGYSIDGRYHPSDESNLDLFMRPEKRSFWTNIYPWGVTSNESKEICDKSAGHDRIACIETVYYI